MAQPPFKRGVPGGQSPPGQELIYWWIIPPIRLGQVRLGRTVPFLSLVYLSKGNRDCEILINTNILISGNF